MLSHFIGAQGRVQVSSSKTPFFCSQRQTNLFRFSQPPSLPLSSNTLFLTQHPIPNNIQMSQKQKRTYAQFYLDDAEIKRLTEQYDEIISTTWRSE
jgi:hypothetical protein